MGNRLDWHDDFEATIRIFTRKEGGRRTPPFNGIRWDFAHAEDGPNPPSLYMIWPDFIGTDGKSLPNDQPLPVDIELPARMTILMDEMRVEVHRGRITPGVRFFCHEGPQRVAEGVVTRVTGLFVPREGAIE
ncbi:hypothetical protein J8F10_30045 [Gemmata sp. G18]|uniref:Translation elongation factor EFTu/EF1A C-terminal domain-containing protein n=1 Tax=Gemmata palustris TaxID=2822762 RepID=A0ABS5C0J5_9BACT|nr:hypothetical protein [Gemmata palustris]MBP3959507.1 hypothetical protein [Gemmata palustris]